MERVLHKKNIDIVIHDYEKSVATIGNGISHLQGISLLEYLKCDKIGSGPYPHVTLFEAANRIMTDMVILKGIKWLLENENNNKHDILAQNESSNLIGEAFNVAPSFFQSKKTATRKKLHRSQHNADYILIIANVDSIKDTYNPEMKENEYFLFVDIYSGKGKLFADNMHKKSERKNIDIFL